MTANAPTKPNILDRTYIATGFLDHFFDWLERICNFCFRPVVWTIEKVSSIWNVFYFLKKPLDDTVKVHITIKTMLLLLMYVIIGMHVASVIAFVGFSFEWILENSSTKTLIGFSVTHSGLALIYYFTTRIVSLWYILFDTRVLRNLRYVKDIEFAIFGTAAIYVAVTLGWGVNYGMSPFLFPVSRALMIFRYICIPLSLTSLIALITIYTKLGAFRNTQLTMIKTHPEYLDTAKHPLL
jgi:hypothetical protein